VANTDVRTAGPADRELIVRLAFGSMAAQTLRAAVRLRVVELLDGAPRRAAEVAAEAGAEPHSMTRLLRALTALGLLAEHAPGTFSVTPAGALLDPGRPDSLASCVRMFTEPAIVRAWEHLDDSVRTGEVAFDTVFGTDFFSHLGRHPELSAEFNAAMGQAVAETAAALPHAVDFGRFASVTDVGGGDGTLLAGVLAAHPGLTGVVFDTAEGLAGAPRTLERHGLAGRCSLVAGDFFRAVPEGSDLYVVKSVLHDWTDEQAVTILGHCRAVLPPGGRVLIVEPVLPEVVDAAGAAEVTDGGVTYLSDLNMLVNLGGRERTRQDFEEVCHRAGLVLVSVTPLAGAAPFSVIEAAAG
jgi:SAM-dependent methyltransferase